MQVMQRSVGLLQNIRQKLQFFLIYLTVCLLCVYVGFFWVLRFRSTFSKHACRWIGYRTSLPCVNLIAISLENKCPPPNPPPPQNHGVCKLFHRVVYQSVYYLSKCIVSLHCHQCKNMSTMSTVHSIYLLDVARLTVPLTFFNPSMHHLKRK